MSKCLLILSALLGAIVHNVSAHGDTTVPFPISPGQPVVNNTGEFLKPPAVTMNGHNNYYAPQQIFYLYGLQHLRLQKDDKLVDKAESGYLITSGLGGHKLHTRNLSWNQARKACIEEGGHLAIINSKSEENILLHMLKENKINRAWLGIHDLFEEGDWVTVMDEALESTGYTRWHQKYGHNPDHYSKRNCGVLLNVSEMDDIDCKESVAFFCEIPA